MASSGSGGLAEEISLPGIEPRIACPTCILATILAVLSRLSKLKKKKQEHFRG